MKSAQRMALALAATLTSPLEAVSAEEAIPNSPITLPAASLDWMFGAASAVERQSNGVNRAGIAGGSNP